MGDLVSTMNTCTAPSSTNTDPMPLTSDPLKLLMEDIEKTQTLSDKYVKIQTYLVSLKKEMSNVIYYEFPHSKQFLYHAIKTLEVEQASISEKLKSITNETGVTNVDVLPEKMIRVTQNPSLHSTNTVLQAPQISMQSRQGTLYQGLGQHLFSLQTKTQLQQYQQFLQHQKRRLVQPQITKPNQLKQEQQRLLQQKLLLQQQYKQQRLLQPQVMKQSQLQQNQDLLQHLGHQVFGQQE